jgi:hypothetical protein
VGGEEEYSDGFYLSSRCGLIDIESKETYSADEVRKKLGIEK